MTDIMLLGVCRQKLLFIKRENGEVVPPHLPHKKILQEYEFTDESDYFPFILSDLSNAKAQVASFSLYQVLLNHTF